MLIKDAKEFGKILRERRKELHYTQAYLSEVSGMSISFISDVERGKKTAEIGKTIELLNLLGLNLIVERRE